MKLQNFFTSIIDQQPQENSLLTSVLDRYADRQEIEQQTQEFLARGGKIQKVDFGVMRKDVPGDEYHRKVDQEFINTQFKKETLQ